MMLTTSSHQWSWFQRDYHCRLLRWLSRQYFGYNNGINGANLECRTHIKQSDGPHTKAYMYCLSVRSLCSLMLGNGANWSLVGALNWETASLKCSLSCGPLHGKLALSRHLNVLLICMTNVALNTDSTISKASYSPSGSWTAFV